MGLFSVSVIAGIESIIKSSSSSGFREVEINEVRQ